MPFTKPLHNAESYIQLKKTPFDCHLLLIGNKTQYTSHLKFTQTKKKPSQEVDTSRIASLRIVHY